MIQFKLYIRGGLELGADRFRVPVGAVSGIEIRVRVPACKSPLQSGSTPRVGRLWLGFGAA